MSNKGFFGLTIYSVVFFVLATSLMVFYCIRKEQSPEAKLQVTDGEKANRVVYGYEDIYQENIPVQDNLEEDEFYKYLEIANCAGVFTQNTLN